MHPDEAKFLLDFLLPRLKSEQATTKKILSAVPPDKGDYKPHPKSMSSLKLSWHLAATEMWFLDAVIDHVFKEDDSPMPSELKPGADIARWYDENFARRLPRLESKAPTNPSHPPPTPPALSLGAYPARGLVFRPEHEESLLGVPRPRV